MAEGLRIPITVDFKNSLQKLNEARKAITDFGTSAEKSLGIIGTSASAAASALTPLAQAAASAKSAIIAFGEGKGNIETVIPLFQELVAQAGGIDQAFEQLQDIPFFEEFVRGAEEAVLSAERLDGKDVKVNFGAEGLESVKTQLRQANEELNSAIINFGKGSTQAAAAAERVKELKDIIEDSGNAVKSADLAGKFALAGRAIQGLSAGFQTVTALQAVFGEQSKETEAALKKVQAVMALTQGIQGIIEGSKALATLGASGIAAFKNLVNGIAAATGATRGFAAAIASTGIGLLVVGLGLLIPKLVELFSSTKNAANALADLSNAEKTLAGDLERTNRLIDERNKALDFSAKKAVLQAKIAGKTQEEINQIEAAAREEGISKAKSDAEKASKVFIDAQKKALTDLSTIRREGSKEEIAQAEKQAKDLLDKLRDDALRKKAVVTQLENDAVLASLQTQADGIDKRKKENEKSQQDEIAKLKAFGQKRVDALRLNEELSISTASATQQKLFNIERDFEDKRKKLIEGGITDFTALEAAKAKAINDVINQANNESLRARQGYEKALENIIVSALQRQLALIKNSNELAFRAQLAGITDQYDKRAAELQNAEQAEIDALNEKYGKKKEDYEQYWIDLANIRKFYQAENDKNTQDRNSKEENDLKNAIENQKQILASGIADAATAFGEALATGADPFQAAFKSIATSLGNYLQKLGKEAILASTLFNKLRSQIFTPQGIGIGIALIALGAIIKASFNKKAEKGFARGGYIEGPGTETSDSIPARLSKGEYVVKAQAVRKYGRSFFDTLNKSTNSDEITDNIISRGRNGESAKALVNRFEAPSLFARGGFITGPGTETSDSIPARLSRGEYVIRASVVKNIGKIFFDRINNNLLPPTSILSRQANEEGNLAEAVKQFTRNGESAKALVNRFESPLLFANGGYVDDFWENIISKGRNGGSTTALVNRMAPGGDLGEAIKQFTRHGGTSKALVNRFEVPDFGQITNPAMPRMQTSTEPQIIATTKVSGQDLKIILERADRRYSNVT